jgi:1-acyl-sn-glycerol-3-phosphate acyltransferase
MDENMKISDHRVMIEERIASYEREGLWHLDVEDDPETYPLMPGKVDYLNKRLTSRIMNKIANAAGTLFFDRMIKKRQLIIKEIRGIENFTAVTGGRIVTCNHFSICDNYAVWVALREHMEGRMLYKIIREGNYTNPPKPFGLIMRHCNTLPLSSQVSTMKHFLHAMNVLLGRGETVLIYPEQSMWPGYRKPKPLQDGAFSLAVKNNAPIVPIFITMTDSDVPDGEGGYVQEYTVNILPAIYPSDSLSRAEAREKMKKENYEAWVKVYEDFYGIPLRYGDV